jgi:hypothetical protein
MLRTAQLLESVLALIPIYTDVLRFFELFKDFGKG